MHLCYTNADSTLNTEYNTNIWSHDVKARNVDVYCDVTT